MRNKAGGLAKQCRKSRERGAGGRESPLLPAPGSLLLAPCTPLMATYFPVSTSYGKLPPSCHGYGLPWFFLLFGLLFRTRSTDDHGRYQRSGTGTQPPRELSSEILDRLPPQNLEAEKASSAACLLDPQLCDEVALLLRADDFYADANQRLYRHLFALHDEGKRVDITLLVERLKQAGEYEAIGGAAYLAEVAQSVPYAAQCAALRGDRPRQGHRPGTDPCRHGDPPRRLGPRLRPAEARQRRRREDLRRTRPAEQRPDHAYPGPAHRGLRPHRRPAGPRRRATPSPRISPTWTT